MIVMVSRITGQSSACSTVFRLAITKKLSLCEWNLTMTGGFPAQRDNNAHFFPHGDFIMYYPKL